MKLFFMHVPKTAGTSFRRFLERSMRARSASVSARERDAIWSDESESYPSYDAFVAPEGAAHRACDLVCGHYPWHVVELLPPETQVITVLRDPLERSLSHVKHQIALEQQAGSGGEVDVNRFLAAPRNEMFLHTIGNLAVKYLSSPAHPDALVPVETLSLDRAVANACRAHVGFADELAAFQRRLAAQLFGNAGDAEPLRFENRSADRFAVTDLSARNRDLLRDLNELDQELQDLMRQVLVARRMEAEVAVKVGARIAEPDRWVFPSS